MQFLIQVTFEAHIRDKAARCR